MLPHTAERDQLKTHFHHTTSEHRPRPDADTGASKLVIVASPGLAVRVAIMVPSEEGEIRNVQPAVMPVSSCYDNYAVCTCVLKYVHDLCIT